MALLMSRIEYPEFTLDMLDFDLLPSSPNSHGKLNHEQSELRYSIIVYTVNLTRVGFPIRCANLL